jgi:hypothetical protein
MKTLELTRVGEHRMEGGLYKDKNGKYYVDCHSEIESGKFGTVYRLSPSTEPDGEPDVSFDGMIFITNPPTKKELREKAFRHDYMMLSAMQTNCKYYQSADHYNRAHVSTIQETIEEMKKLWHKFPEDLKPEWISLEEIEGYEKKFNLTHTA